MEGPKQADVDAITWWHPFTFPNGVKARGTKGGQGSERAEEIVQAEADLVFKYPVQGKSVLDVGAWQGYFSVESLKRGAKRVVALDLYSSKRRGLAGIELVKQYLAPDLEVVDRDLMDLRQLPVGIYDWVLFLGVLYHLRHPLYALEILSEIAMEHLVIETHLDLLNYGRPAMVFYPGAELVGDHSNWWGPNIQCVVDMLKTVGFAKVEHTIHPFAPSRAVFHAFK